MQINCNNMVIIQVSSLFCGFCRKKKSFSMVFLLCLRLIFNLWLCHATHKLIIRVYRFWLFVSDFMLLCKKQCQLARKKISSNRTSVGQFLTGAILDEVSQNFGQKWWKRTGRPKFIWFAQASIAIFHSVLTLKLFILRKILV